MTSENRILELEEALQSILECIKGVQFSDGTMYCRKENELMHIWLFATNALNKNNEDIPVNNKKSRRRKSIKKVLG